MQNWWAVLWAVITGFAAGVAADWERFYDRHYAGKPGFGGKKKKASPEPGKPEWTKEAAAPFTRDASPPPAPTPEASPSTAPPGPKVQVDVARREGEFATGVPFINGSRVSMARREPVSRDGERRRKRRTKPAPTPAETICARCKAAAQHDLTTVEPADLALTQEAETDELPAAPTAAEGEKTSGEEAQPQEARPEEKPKHRGPIAGRIVTTLGTRGALMRAVGPSATNHATGG